jgi:hypothetical protein
LPFAAQFLNKKTNCLQLDDLTTDLIFSFLEYLEAVRKNSTQQFKLQNMLQKQLRISEHSLSDLSDF